MTQKKFRAWDGKKMHYWDSVTHSATKEIAGTPYPKLYYLPMSWLLGDSNDWLWTQFTGLKDKNGKEIYEGDLITYYRSGNKVHRRVEWDNVTCGYPMLTYNPFDIEIIGNIYENPELLKV